jgi:hypothetical protein
VRVTITIHNGLCFAYKSYFHWISISFGGFYGHLVFYVLCMMKLGKISFLVGVGYFPTNYHQLQDNHFVIIHTRLGGVLLEVYFSKIIKNQLRNLWR